MSNFKTGLIKEFEEQRNFEEEQKKLHEKHEIENEEVIVVEKNNWLKFFIRLFITFVKTLASIVLVSFAAIGIFAMCYASIRTPLFNELSNVVATIF